MKSNKKKIFANIFIGISITFLATMVLVYGGRFIYYYRNSHIKEEVGETLLVDVINSLSYNGSMVKEENNLYYSGNIMSNYLYYSNRYYRIIGIENGNIVLVDDDISTILPYNGEDYKTSDINKWLNKTDEENTGIYYNSLINPDKYLTTTKTCLDNYSGENITCENYVESNVGLLSLNQYLRANINGNYLNKNSYYWFSNKDAEEHNWYIDSKNEVTITNSESLYGVRAVITLKPDTVYYGGSGTLFEPYLITLEDAENFGDVKTGSIGIGSYITFNDSKWRVIGSDEENYKIVSVDSIGTKVFSNKTNKINLKDKESLIYYLNNEYYETYEGKYLQKGIFNIASYDTSYLDKYSEQEELNVGLLEIGDLYPNDLDNTYTLTNTGRRGTIFKVIGGRLYSDSHSNENEVRPVVFINKSIKAKGGYGTIDNPYEVGEA